MRIPKYRKHSSRDFGFVEMDGKRFRLPGRYNSAESLAQYHDIVAKMQRETIAPLPPVVADDSMPMASLCARYLMHCEATYGRKSRGEYRNNADAVLHVIRHFATVRVVDFTPRVMRELQDRLANTKKKIRTKAGFIETDENLSRKYVNSLIERVRRMFSWAVAEELVSGSQFHALREVKGLRRGRSAATETPKRQPVPLPHVAAVLRHVTKPIRVMLRVQVLTGARSDSICNAKPEQFDRSGDVWLWRPSVHKTQYIERDLVVAIGPRCQRVLKPYIDATPPTEFIFRPRSTRNSSRYGARYKPHSYALAVERAIERANATRPPEKQIPHWSPHCLRHSKGTEVNEQFGLEAAAAALGHDDLSATKLYRSKRLSLAKTVARETG